jgi:hypothetical protein
MSILKDAKPLKSFYRAFIVTMIIYWRMEVCMTNTASLRSRVPGNCAPRNAVLNPRQSREKFGGILLGHPTYLKAKAGGENSLSEKQGALEGV